MAVHIFLRRQNKSVCDIPVFFFQTMNFYKTMQMRKTLASGPTESEPSTLRSSMPRPKDWQPPARGGRRGRVRPRRRRRSEAARSCTRSCRESTPSTWRGRRGRRRRLARGRSSATKRNVQPPSRAARHPPPPS